MTEDSVSIEQDEPEGEAKSSGFRMHEFAQKHQFIMGVVFSLTTLGILCAIIALIAALPHSNTPYGSRNAASHAVPPAPLSAQMNDIGPITGMKAPLAVGRSVVEIFWPEEAQHFGHQLIEP